MEEEDGELELCTLEMDKQEDSVINPDLQTKQKQDLQVLLIDLSKTVDNKPGRTSLAVHKIRTGSPTYSPAPIQSANSLARRGTSRDSDHVRLGCNRAI